MAMSVTKSSSPRRYDLDWLRVCAIMTVFVFHSSRFFDTDGWHVKNPTTYFGVQVWITFLANWLMPLIFVISGASLFYAIKSRGARQFITDKVLRLLVPLIFGMFTHVMLQVYLERLTHHQFTGSFYSFIPHYFDGWYGYGGNFAWMGLHLWYLLVLFIYSLLCYPLCRWLLMGLGKRLLDGFGQFLALPGTIYGLALPVAWLMVKIRPSGIMGMRDFGGWPLPIYLLFFLFGFFIISNEDLLKRIQKQRWISLMGGILCFFVLLALWGKRGDPIFGSSRYLQVFGIFGISAWCWILVFFGFGSKHLTRSTPFLTYANEAVLPFYIMHQTALLVVGFYVTRWDIPDLLKFVMISGSSFISMTVFYEFLIRRINFLRFLFGMKQTAKKRTATPPKTSFSHVKI
jgi:glucan biosynthesis protein C